MVKCIYYPFLSTNLSKQLIFIHQAIVKHANMTPQQAMEWQAIQETGIDCTYCTQSIRQAAMHDAA